jgi:hypothetical protein
MELIFARMAERWGSDVVSRGEVGRFTGGTLSPRTLANYDSAGRGCPRYRCGRKVVYRVSDFVAWLEKRTQAVPPRKQRSEQE